MSWAVTGARSKIIKELADITGEQMVRLDINCADPGAPLPEWLPDTRYFVLCAGVLHGKRILELTGAQIVECLAVNTVNVIRLCEHILDRVEDAAICVVGSESGWKGSYDQLYAASKAAVHAYVKTRRVGRFQQLVAIAPPIILDAGMTLRRADFQQIKAGARKTTMSLHVALRIRDLLKTSNRQNEVVSM